MTEFSECKVGEGTDMTERERLLAVHVLNRNNGKLLGPTKLVAE